ncbi:MAG: hypothetical protein IKC23_05235 [Fibrobacter sp.]|nr:hypothetical protein [Fibrobacter sp.]
MVRPSSRGFVLPLVAVLLLSLTLLFTTLLKSAGHMNPVYARFKSDFENFYKAESAVLLHLQGFPSGYYPELPPVQAEPFGPWEKICASAVVDSSGKAPGVGELCFVAGTEPHDVSFWEWSNGMSAYRADLEKRLQEMTAEKDLYGNRRYFQGEQFMSGAIHHGDLEMDFSDSVRSASFWVEGTALVRGKAHFDTLRLYSLGDVVFQGEMSVGYLELFTRGGFRAEGDVRFRGVVLASSFRMQDRARSLFPTAIVATWSESDENDTAQNSEDDPGGILFPAFIEGKRKIWGRL